MGAAAQERPRVSLNRLLFNMRVCFSVNEEMTACEEQHLCTLAFHGM